MNQEEPISDERRKTILDFFREHCKEAPCGFCGAPKDWKAQLSALQEERDAAVRASQETCTELHALEGLAEKLADAVEGANLRHSEMCFGAGPHCVCGKAELNKALAACRKAEND